MDQECEKIKKYSLESRKKEISCLQDKARKLRGLVISSIGRKGRRKGRSNTKTRKKT